MKQQLGKLAKLLSADTTDATVQAVVNTSNVAEQADACPPQPIDDSSAEQAGWQHSPLEHAVQQHQVSPLAAQSAHSRPQQVRDEFCLDYYYKLLQEQNRSKEKQMRDFSEKRSFGFKLNSSKKPFHYFNLRKVYTPKF